MKKVSQPVYSPPVDSLADYYHPPEGSKEGKSSKIFSQDIAGEKPSYSPPVPSLGDYYHAESSTIKPTKTSPKKTKAAGKAKKNMGAKNAKKKK